MSFINNIIYAGLVSAGVIYGGIELDKATINKIVKELNTTYNSNPYTEVIHITPNNSRAFVSNGVSFRQIPMDDMSSWTAAEWIAKMLFTERRTSASEKELRLIAATALNYALHKDWTIEQVCSNKKHYSGVMRPHNKNWMDDPDRIHKQIAWDIVEEYKNGVPAEWEASFFFCNMDWVSKNNPTAYKWFKTLEPIDTVQVPGHGTHTFFRSPKWDNELSNNPDMKITKKHLS